MDHFMPRDESWVLCDTPKQTRHWLRSGPAAPTKAKADGHQEKRLLCVRLNVRSTEHWEVVPEGRTIRAEVYANQLV
ncbi:hypothetical protein M514_02106 [Trichuris suis]|uniref:Uncharacterized protein n=1 Tax=Trichuris suis TaxID=68888 RepID=A0A085MI03_9BILA|nr:hypothetical protein M513_02106 [Trichuris suis]KFD70585.1 hypothetical protein M514_02106 [Trichuris suis]